MTNEETVTDIINELATEMCEKYCRFPSEVSDPDQMDEICANCPLTRL